MTPPTRKVKRAALVSLAFLVPALAPGAVTLAVRLHGQGRSLDAAPAGAITIPAARLPVSTRLLAVIVVGNHGTEITDSLPIVELLAASGAFEVRLVAPERTPSPFATNTAGDAGLDFVPDLRFRDYDELVARDPDLLVVPYLHRWRSDDASVIPWIRAHVGPTTGVLSICRGAELAAAAGLFDGYEATANDGMFDTLAARHPGVRWKRGVRWVRDGARVSSALLAAGLDATLAAIDSLAGHGAVVRSLAVTGYRRLPDLGDRWQGRSRVPIGLVLEGGYRWERSHVGVVIDEGVAESTVAGLLDAYATTLTTDVIAVAASRRVIHSRSGVALLPRGTTAELGVRARLVSAVGPIGAYGYDVAIGELAASLGGSAARLAAELLNYPSQMLDLSGGQPPGLGVLVRPMLLGTFGLLAAVWILSSFVASVDSTPDAGLSFRR